MEKNLSVAAIESGTVIDHLPAGSGLKIVRLLNLAAHKKKVTLGLNLPSKTMGYKDIIKVEDREISEKEASQIAVFAPKATINIIRDFRVAKKFSVSMPHTIEKILLCPNERCITHYEPIDTKFRVACLGEQIELECYFCEKSFPHDAY